MRCSKRLQHGGFTLVELLVSALILSIGLVGVSQLYIASLWTYKKSRNVAIATQRAQFELEKARSLGFAKLEPNATKSLVPNYYSDGYTLLTNLPQGKKGVSYTIAELPQGTGMVTIEHYKGYSYLLLVTIEITWQGNPRGQSPVKIITLIAKAP